MRKAVGLSWGVGTRRLCKRIWGRHACGVQAAAAVFALDRARNDLFTAERARLGVLSHREILARLIVADLPSDHPSNGPHVKKIRS